MTYCICVYGINHLNLAWANLILKLFLLQVSSVAWNSFVPKRYVCIVHTMIWYSVFEKCISNASTLGHIHQSSLCQLNLQGDLVAPLAVLVWSKLVKGNDLSRRNIARLVPHYIDVVMSAMAPQITGVTIVYSTVCSGADQRKYQSSTSLALVRGIHR